MKNTLLALSLTVVLPLVCLGLITGCAADADVGAVTLEGRVLDTQNEAVSNAVVHATLDGDELDVTETDEEGYFTLGFELDETADVTVTTNKDGASSSTTVTAFASADPLTVGNLTLAFNEEEVEQTSGTPSNIVLLSQSSESIGVKESGATEVANISFQVTDSTGKPVTLDHQTPVRFRLGQQPGGGEFIAPEEATTNNNGEVTVNLSSGTTSGVVQLIAEVEGEDETIRSKPASVTIHGGLPDQDHFTLTSAQNNIAALDKAGETNAVSVIVGDKYSNPVRPGTAVYFNSSHGVIEGDVTTDDQGRGSVNFTSGNPRPSDDGIVIVEAETANEDEAQVYAQTPMVLSGRINLEVEPTEAILDETYTVTLTDQLGNPLAEGTQLSVTADGNRVQATGNNDVSLDDTQFDVSGSGENATYDVVTGPGITEFTFRAVPDQNEDQTGDSELESITINVSGPNGSLEIVLTDDGSVVTTSDDAVVTRSGEAASIEVID